MYAARVYCTAHVARNVLTINANGLGTEISLNRLQRTVRLTDCGWSYLLLVKCCIFSRRRRVLKIEGMC